MNFVQIGALTAEIWRHIHFSRWRPRPLNTTSGFVFVVQQAHQISFTYLHSRLRYNYFRFWKTNAILEFYFWFWSWPFHRYSASGCPNRTMNCGNMTSCRFSRWRPSAMFCLLWGNGRPPTEFFLWSELGPEIACSQINSSGDIAAMYRPKFWSFGLKLLIHALFREFLGHIFPRWRHPSSWPPKGPFLGRNTSSEPFSVRIGATVRAGRAMKKKGQDNKRSQNCYISPI